MIAIRELALNGAHTDTTGYANCLQVEYPFRIGTWFVLGTCDFERYEACSGERNRQLLPFVA